MGKDSNFRVIPGLSVKPEELKRRIQTRQFVPTTEGQVYNVDREIAAVSNMNRADIARSYVKDQQRKEKLEIELRDVHVKSQKAIDEKIKADLKELADRRAKEGKGE